MSMDWFRSWHGAPTDDKWMVVAKRSETQVYAVSALVWALFDHASKNEVRGQVLDFDFETYSAKSGMEEETARKIYSALEKYPTGREVIKQGQLVNWEKRQPKREDNSSDRVKKHREKKKNETPCNAEETQSNAPDTDTDTDTEKKEVVDDRARAEPETVFSRGEKIAEIVGWKDDPRWLGNYSRLQVWIDGGHDFDLDILPTVKRIMAKKTGPPPSSLAYFEKAIADAKAQRLSPMPKGNTHDQRPRHNPSAVDANFAGFAVAARERQEE